MVLKKNKWKNRWTLVVRTTIGYPYYKGICVCEPCVTTEIITGKFDVLRGRLLGTTMDVKLVGYDFRGHTRWTLVVGIAYGCPYYKGSAIFSLVFFKYHKWKIVYSLQSLCRSANPQGLSSSAKSLVQLGNNFVREAEGCRWELKARNSAVQLCASYDSSCFVAAGLVVDLTT